VRLESATSRPGFELYAEDYDRILTPVGGDYWFARIAPYVGRLEPEADPDFYATGRWIGYDAPGLSCPALEIDNPDDGPLGAYGLNFPNVVAHASATRLEEVPREAFILTDAYGYLFSPPPAPVAPSTSTGTATGSMTATARWRRPRRGTGTTGSGRVTPSGRWRPAWTQKARTSCLAICT